MSIMTKVTSCSSASEALLSLVKVKYGNNNIFEIL